MSVFAAYARYYDLLYRDKNYDLEAEFVANLLKEFSPNAKTLLDLGCGTGRHACSLAPHGYRVTGVDRSHLMIEMANSRRVMLDHELADAVSFSVGDALTYKSERRFDAAASLFHVLSYQTSDEQVVELLSALRRNVSPSGTVLFDYWHGPAVEAITPTRRELHLEDDSVSITRTATPQWDRSLHRVDVHYEVLISRKDTQETETIRECHSMRYFYQDEIRAALDASGLIHLDGGGWLRRTPPSDECWGAWTAARVP